MYYQARHALRSILECAERGEHIVEPACKKIGSIPGRQAQMSDEFMTLVRTFKDCRDAATANPVAVRAAHTPKRAAGPLLLDNILIIA